MKNTLLKFAALTFMLLLCSYGFAQKKTFIREYVYQASEADSKLTARKIAIQEMQTLLLQEIGQALQSEQALKKLSVTKDGKEIFSESFSQEIMAITAGFVEMKVLNEAWNGKTYYIKAQMLVNPKEVSQRVAEVLNNKQKEKELEKREHTRTKSEQAKTETEKRVWELEEQKREIEARKKEMALKQELARLEEIEAKEQAKQERKLAYRAKQAGILYQPNALGLSIGLITWIEGSVNYTRNISPKFGFDILKLNYSWWNMHGKHFQLLTGLRFATNRFGVEKAKNTYYFYTSVRAGVGFFNYGDYYGGYYKYSGPAFATELEGGFHFKYFFLALAVNQGFFRLDHYSYGDSKTKGDLVYPLVGLRLGWDIGKRVAY
jgi:hypothetical protein